LSLRAIAAKVARAPSTFSREVKRNDGLDNYHTALAGEAVWVKHVAQNVVNLQAALGSEVQMKIPIGY